MSKASIITHKGKEVLLMDFTNTPDKEAVLKTVEDVKVLAETRKPDMSTLGIVDISGSPYDSDIIKALKEMALHNKPYMKVSAIVGATGIKEALLKAILMFSGRKNLVTKSTRDEALDWLVQQP